MRTHHTQMQDIGICKPSTLNPAETWVRVRKAFVAHRAPEPSSQIPPTSDSSENQRGSLESGTLSDQEGTEDGSKPFGSGLQRGRSQPRPQTKLGQRTFPTWWIVANRDRWRFRDLGVYLRRMQWRARRAEKLNTYVLLAPSQGFWV